MIFDVLIVGGKDTMAKPFRECWELLRWIVAPVKNWVLLSDST